MSGYDTLCLQRDGAVAHLILQRPEAANALDLAMAKDLLGAALELDADETVRAVLLRGEGKLFCAGGDLKSFSRDPSTMGEVIKETTIYLHAALTRLARLRAPVIAAVHGAAAGAGFSLACAADLVVAAESCRWSMAYTRAGLTPDGSSTYFLPRLVGRKRTLELMLTNRTLSSEEALDWGLANRVVPDDEVTDHALTLARQLAEGPTVAFGKVKELVLRSHSETLETQMDLESQAISEAARTQDAKEGIEAFFAKRAPEFQGR